MDDPGPSEANEPRSFSLPAAQGVQIGDGNAQNVFFAGRPATRWPLRLGVVPPLADCRQTRSVDDEVYGAAGATVVLCQVFSGLGGVGKTQLAAALAERVWLMNEVDLLLWVTASDRTAIVAAYAQAATEVLNTQYPDAGQAAARFMAWLAATDKRWLVVLDDLSNPNDLHQMWPPLSGQGRTVVTTRRRDAVLAASGRRLIQVGLFTPEESRTYLEAKLADHSQLLDEVDGLAADLGHLPLALAQAAVYMLDRAVSCKGYRSRLADRRRRLADLVPEAEALPDDHATTLAATWSLSVRRANELYPVALAAPMLQLASVLDPNGIPADVFTSKAVLSWLTSMRGQVVDADNARDALRCLHRLNLITHDPASPTRAVRVHALVQRATREQAPSGQIAQAAGAAADGLFQAWPAIELDPGMGQTLQANAYFLAGVRPDELWTADSAHPVLFRAGDSLGELGQVTACADYFQQLHDACHGRLGPSHPDTLRAASILADWRGQAGQAGAADTFEQLVAEYTRSLGPDHLDTLAARGGLAYWRGEAGQSSAAAVAFDQLLVDYMHTLGPEHPHTLATRHNIADMRGHLGDANRAVAAYRELLADRTRLLGVDHPHTLATRHNLADWLGQAGDATGAATAYRELLVDRLRVLGPDHPHSLATRHNLAFWLGQAGNPTGAAAACRDLLADRQRVLGPDHPHTLVTRHILAHWCGTAGEPAAAASALEELLADRIRVQHRLHAHVLVTRRDLANWREQAGDTIGAAIARQALLEDLLEVQGLTNPYLAMTHHNLARWRTHPAAPE